VNMISPGPIALCILDGWGERAAIDYNAIKNANPICFNRLCKEFPSTTLIASGPSVGLPEGQMGNSEVGHMAIGSGRLIRQSLVKINSELNSTLQRDPITELISNLNSTKKTCHLIGLASDGGVHSHIDHLITIAQHLTKNQVKVNLHLITDGRDTDPTHGRGFVQRLNEMCKTNALLSISTISGREYAMDRDKRFERVERAFRAISFGSDKTFDCPVAAVSASYAEGITDEFITPQSHASYKGMEDGDAVIFCNFRADRTRQLCGALLDLHFSGFKRDKSFRFSKAITLMPYSKALEAFAIPLFRHELHKNTLCEVLNSHGKSSLRIAETEKYAHITFFFDAGREVSYPNEKRIIIPSPKVATYENCPEMSANEITDTVLSELEQNKYDFVLLNYANPDMVGHTGNYQKTIKAVKTVDDCLQRLYDYIVEQLNGTLVIVGDHGNAEQVDNTAHTTNPVPFIIANKGLKGATDGRLQSGSLVDVAPTLLSLFGIQKPTEMSGKCLQK